jgi:hypothetical protein
MLKVPISKAEMELVWPVITLGKGGQVSIEKFVDFAKKPAANRRASNGTAAALERKQSRRQSNSLMLQAQSTGRASRIRRASVSVGIREAVKAYLAKHSVSPPEMFKQLDDDSTGVISKKELHEALLKLKFSVSQLVGNKSCCLVFGRF